MQQETLAVGAEHSSALAETTWDFETGDLVGWRQTGEAFALQPTYGDNPYFRGSSRGSGGWNRSKKSRLRGRCGSLFVIVAPDLASRYQDLIVLLLLIRYRRVASNQPLMITWTELF